MGFSIFLLPNCVLRIDICVTYRLVRVQVKHVGWGHANRGGTTLIGVGSHVNSEDFPFYLTSMLMLRNSTERQRVLVVFLYSHKICNDKQLQYKSKGSMEIHNNPKTYTKRRDTDITEIFAKYLATKG